jgi:hypothetical protein
VRASLTADSFRSLCRTMAEDGWAAYFFSSGRFVELRDDQIRSVPLVLS